MKTIGLDIGTTSVSAVVIHDGSLVESRCVESKAFIASNNPWEKIQDPEKLCSIAEELCCELLELHPDAERIGITGQQHGIVYLDKKGATLSPLYIWQDGRGDLPHDTQCSWASHIRQQTGHMVASGYGIVTHIYNVAHSLVPAGAKVFCTINDLVAMRLAGLSRPVTDATDACSIGLFDIRKKEFDESALRKMGVDCQMLPQVTEGCLGEFKKCKVYVAIGDNQASFIGATLAAPGAVLVNIGTGSQISLHTPDYKCCKGLETRPFPDGGYLLVGATLCGGRAYAMLDSFFCDVVEMQTGERPAHCYDAMKKAVESLAPEACCPQISPLFQGTRENPALRGSIEGIDTSNFTPAHFIKGMLDGMARELKDMYSLCCDTAPRLLYASGNGVRLNSDLQKSLEMAFQCPLKLSQFNEEAAAGAALYASMR